MTSGANTALAACNRTTMPAFPRNPFTSWKHGQTHRLLKKHPSIFGVPFLLLIVGSSFALQPFTQARYDLQDKKITAARRRRTALHLAHLTDDLLCTGIEGAAVEAGAGQEEV